MTRKRLIRKSTLPKLPKKRQPNPSGVNQQGTPYKVANIEPCSVFDDFESIPADIQQAVSKIMRDAGLSKAK